MQPKKNKGSVLLVGEWPRPAQAAPTESVPSWLGDFGAAEEEQPAQAAPAENVPSWLGEFGATEEEQPAPAEAAPAEGVPDWLGTFGAATAVVAAAGEEEEFIPEAAEAAPLGDDWLQSFGQMTDQPAEAAEAAEPVGDLGIPGWQINRDATKETPSTPHPFIEEGLPAWMSSIDQPIIPEESAAAALYEEPDSNPLTADQGTPFQVDLPDWIGEEPAPMAASASLEGEEEPQLELAQAELPSWVEDMRPVESAIGGELTSDGDQRIEKAGPLAGLRGILPGEDTAVRYRKLPVYSVKLRVSERQRQYINLLDNVISLENQPQAIPALPSKAPQFILRLAIGILLIVGLLLPPLFDVQISALPSVAPEGMLELYDMVEGLPADAPVLLAVDYEPALSGEMKLASSAVIEHLMVKNARIAVVSTVPTGPIMAEQLLDDIHLRQPGYDLDNQTVNLSYLAGGTSSLLEFANRPRSAAPVALDTSVTGQSALAAPRASRYRQSARLCPGHRAHRQRRNRPRLGRAGPAHAGQHPPHHGHQCPGRPAAPALSQIAAGRRLGFWIVRRGHVRETLRAGQSARRLLYGLPGRVPGGHSGAFPRWDHLNGHVHEPPGEERQGIAAMDSQLIFTLVGFVLTLMVFSYIFGDNFLFRLASYLFVGVSGGYVGALVIDQVIFPRLIYPTSARALWPKKSWRASRSSSARCS